MRFLVVTPPCAWHPALPHDFLVPGVEIIRIDFHRPLEMGESLSMTSAGLFEVAAQVPSLGLFGPFFPQPRENPVGRVLSAFAGKHPLATETVAFHPAKAVRHQFKSAPVMRFH